MNINIRLYRTQKTSFHLYRIITVFSFEEATGGNNCLIMQKQFYYDKKNSFLNLRQAE